MNRDRDIIDLLAVWELVHESADEGLKAAIARGALQDAGDAEESPGAFVDGLSAMVDVRKDEIKRSLAGRMPEGVADAAADGGASADVLEELRFEVALLRGAIESLTAQVDALARAQGGAPRP